MTAIFHAAVRRGLQIECARVSGKSLDDSVHADYAASVKELPAAEREVLVAALEDARRRLERALIETASPAA
jgi:hypothetical protein